MAKKKFFVKEDDGVYSVGIEFFNDIETRQEALAIALRTLGEIHNTLYEESTDKTQYIGNLKVTTGLQRCLDELDKRWPGVFAEIYAVSRNINGKTLGLS